MTEVKDHINLMGVVNLTPDSFSDGGFYNSPNSALKRIQFLQEAGIHVFDFGAESTAPMNTPISAQEEFNRYEETLLPILSQLPYTGVFSIDTYHKEVVAKLVPIISDIRPNLKIWWNDVSGKLDADFWEVMQRFPKLHYVYCHNLAPKRDRTAEHMGFLMRDPVIIELRRYFLAALQAFNDRGLGDRVLFDPCFGFSKTREQNLFIIDRLSELTFGLEMVPWVLGVSKKSFLRSEEDNNLLGDEKFRQSEIKHKQILKKWIQSHPKHELYLRVHDPYILS